MNEAPPVPGYRLISLLGKGGMGRVYLAEDMTLGRRAAIKFVSEKGDGDAESKARFLREARTMATVEHAHVVRVYSFGEIPEGAYMVMEYVAGESLARLLKRAGRLSLTEATRYTLQVAEALDAAWEQRLVHRDIKPSNILLDGKGQVRVADFGLAKPLGIEAGEESLTKSGSILGSPPYVSPEQAMGQDVDARSDIYSLGIVMYEMLAGERPFRGKTPYDIVAQHLHDPLPSLSTRRPDLPQSVTDLVNWMTEKIPDNRPQSYPSLIEYLTALSEVEGRAVKAPAPVAARPAPGPRGQTDGVSRGVLAGLFEGVASIGRRLTREPAPEVRKAMDVPPVRPAPPPPEPVRAAPPPVEEEVVYAEDLGVFDMTMVAPSLKTVSASGASRSFPVSLSGRTTIGRARRNDIVVADEKASADHCEIDIEGTGLMIRDLGSSNGTWLNGKTVEKAILKHGDRIKVGDTVLAVNFHGGS